MKTKSARRLLKSGMPKTRLELQHTQNCTVLPNRHMLLDRLPKGGIVAEIGAAFGDFSSEILDRCKPRQLHLIDAWSSERYTKGLAQICADFGDKIEADEVKIHQGISTDILTYFQDGFFDWVYIDTNHSFETTLQELELCRTRVTENGRISGHDYCTGNVVDAVPYGVVEAVNKFCKDHNWQFEFLTLENHGHFSFCLQRI